MAGKQRSGWSRRLSQHEPRTFITGSVKCRARFSPTICSTCALLLFEFRRRSLSRYKGADEGPPQRGANLRARSTSCDHTPASARRHRRRRRRQRRRRRRLGLGRRWRAAACLSACRSVRPLPFSSSSHVAERSLGSHITLARIIFSHWL